MLVTGNILARSESPDWEMHTSTGYKERAICILSVMILAEQSSEGVWRLGRTECHQGLAVAIEHAELSKRTRVSLLLLQIRQLLG